MSITEERARELVYGIHDAWNKRDIDALVDHYTDDMTIWSNVGGPDGGPLVTQGKPALREFCAVWQGFDCLSVPENFHFENGAARCSVEFFIRDPRTGLQHAATYRQIATFRDDRILRLEQYHDAQAMSAFLSLLADAPLGD